jgi:hypothetical protein
MRHWQGPPTAMPSARIAGGPGDRLRVAAFRARRLDDRSRSQHPRSGASLGWDGLDVADRVASGGYWRTRIERTGERMTNPWNFGVTLPQIKRTWDEARNAAITFDNAGFDSVWVCDHVYGVPNPTIPILEGWSLLAAVAAVTQSVELGTLVTPPFFRNPGVLAKQVSTIDQISGGRVIVGLGAGWFKPEFEAYGNPFPKLWDRMMGLVETAQILNCLFTQEL